MVRGGHVFPPHTYTFVHMVRVDAGGSLWAQGSLPCCPTAGASMAEWSRET